MHFSSPSVKTNISSMILLRKDRVNPRHIFLLLDAGAFFCLLLVFLWELLAAVSLAWSSFLSNLDLIVAYVTVMLFRHSCTVLLQWVFNFEHLEESLLYILGIAFDMVTYTLLPNAISRFWMVKIELRKRKKTKTGLKWQMTWFWYLGFRLGVQH